MTSELLVKILSEMVIALPWTISLTIVSFLIGALLAIPLCGLSVSKIRVLRTAAMAVVLICRSIPPIVWLFLIFFGVGSELVSLSPFTSSVIGLGLISTANLAEIYRGAMKAVPTGQYEAANVLGLSMFNRYRYVLVPQIFRVALPSMANYAIGLLKDTAVASTIGVHDMALSANRLAQETFKGLEVYALFGVIYLLLSIVIAYATRGLDGRLRRRIAR